MSTFEVEPEPSGNAGKLLVWDFPPARGLVPGISYQHIKCRHRQPLLCARFVRISVEKLIEGDDALQGIQCGVLLMTRVVQIEGEMDHGG